MKKYLTIRVKNMFKEVIDFFVFIYLTILVVNAQKAQARHERLTMILCKHDRRFINKRNEEFVYTGIHQSRYKAILENPSSVFEYL